MYLFPVEIKESDIEGKGVFSMGKIPKGAIVWKFVTTHDKTLSVEEFESLNENAKTEFLKVGYLSSTSQRYIYPPEDDSARFTNHSLKNNLSVIIDTAISEEPYFVANKDIEAGEELTNNYTEFDDSLKTYRANWI